MQYYKLYGEVQNFIIKMPEGMWIPWDLNNSDYQAFLQYLVDNNLTIDDIPVWE